MFTIDLNRIQGYWTKKNILSIEIRNIFGPNWLVIHSTEIFNRFKEMNAILIPRINKYFTIMSIIYLIKYTWNILLFEHGANSRWRFHYSVFVLFFHSICCVTMTQSLGLRINLSKPNDSSFTCHKDTLVVFLKRK